MAAPTASPVPELQLTTEESTDRVTVHCSGKITSSSTELLLNTVRPLIGPGKRVVLDLTHLNYLDSSGLGAVVRLWGASKKAGGELTVINLNKRIKDLFSLTNLSSIFEGVEIVGM